MKREIRWHVQQYVSSRLKLYEVVQKTGNTFAIDKTVFCSNAAIFADWLDWSAKNGSMGLTTTNAFGRAVGEVLLDAGMRRGVLQIGARGHRVATYGWWGVTVKGPPTLDGIRVEDVDPTNSELSS